MNNKSYFLAFALSLFFGPLAVMYVHIWGGFLSFFLWAIISFAILPEIGMSLINSIIVGDLLCGLAALLMIYINRKL